VAPSRPGLDRSAASYPFSAIRRLIALSSAARAPDGLERGGDWSAGPAGGWACARGVERVSMTESSRLRDRWGAGECPVVA
jgi:hypothetical protein